MVKAKKLYEDMTYSELEEEKRRVFGEITELKVVAKKLAQLMNAKQGEVKVRTMIDNLSSDEREIAKDML